MKGTDVLSNTTIEGLHTLRLQAMASGVIEQREQPDYAALGFEDRAQHGRGEVSQIENLQRKTGCHAMPQMVPELRVRLLPGCFRRRVSE